MGMKGIGNLACFLALTGRTRRRILTRYALLQIPEILVLGLILFVLDRWQFLSRVLSGLVAFLWILKDIVLFPFVWSAYDSSEKREVSSLIGLKGLVEKGIAPRGYVRVRGELWQAEAAINGTVIEKGERVEVEEARGHTLIVRTSRD